MIEQLRRLFSTATLRESVTYQTLEKVLSYLLNREIVFKGKVDLIQADVRGLPVTSVNRQTGDVVLDADDIDDTSTINKYVTAADLVKLSNLSGVNTGDQTSIVGITGTKAQFDTAVTDGNFLYVGDPPSAHTHPISDIVNLQTTLDTKTTKTFAIAMALALG
jgi:hypothetical protein